MLRADACPIARRLGSETDRRRAVGSAGPYESAGGLMAMSSSLDADDSSSSGGLLVMSATDPWTSSSSGGLVLMSVMTSSPGDASRDDVQAINRAVLREIGDGDLRLLARADSGQRWGEKFFLDRRVGEPMLISRLPSAARSTGRNWSFMFGAKSLSWGPSTLLASSAFFKADASRSAESRPFGGRPRSGRTDGELARPPVGVPGHDAPHRAGDRGHPGFRATG